jgi:hypothetical protein
MDPQLPTDTSLAVRQWGRLYSTYVDLRVRRAPYRPDRWPTGDMVTAANGGFVLDNIAHGARASYPERQPEGPARTWTGSRENGFDVRAPDKHQRGRG